MPEHDAETARRHLSHVPAPRGEPYDLSGSVLDILAEGGTRVGLAWTDARSARPRSAGS
ncbi:hypothetical protein AB0F36_19705 [Streptomyces sp. NPDC029080]|uniref:hypothetical protein n=1 Tax=Streptomyces sp. NPDC029080 TaxID=3155017 RepID=UPI0033DE77DA